MPRWPKQHPRPGVDPYGRTPLWYFAFKGDVEGIFSELAAGADPNQGDDVDYTPLHVAVQEGRVDALQALLTAGADPNRVDQHGNGPLWNAVLNAPKAVRIGCIVALLAAGANPDRNNRYGRSPRAMAEEIGHGLELPFASIPRQPDA